MSCDTIMAIKVDNREKEAALVQEILTQNGCLISARLGLHGSEQSCSNAGLIILRLCGSAEEIAALETSLKKISGVKLNRMEI